MASVQKREDKDPWITASCNIHTVSDSAIRMFNDEGRATGALSISPATSFKHLMNVKRPFQRTASFPVDSQCSQESNTPIQQRPPSLHPIFLVGRAHLDPETETCTAATTTATYDANTRPCLDFPSAVAAFTSLACANPGPHCRVPTCRDHANKDGRRTAVWGVHRAGRWGLVP
jgi:hypothetical protein